MLGGPGRPYRRKCGTEYGPQRYCARLARCWRACALCRPRRERSLGNSEVHRNSSRSCRSAIRGRSEEHTSELQSHLNLVCRLLLEKKNKSMNCVPSAQSLAKFLRDV